MNDQETQRIATIQMGSQANDAPRTACHAAECLAEDWLAFLGHRWNALILWHLANGPMRYSELRDVLPGITPKVLSERLAGLTGRLLILRTVSNGFPRETSYQLTPQGLALGPIILQLYDWAEENAARI
tara:strand:+ start:2845 stop:3231 length:387 start_codon:yes stop_codon:yes gene_type:complete